MGFLLVGIAATFVLAAVNFTLTWIKRRREAPLRREIRSRTVVFRTGVLTVRIEQPQSSRKWANIKNMALAMFIRGDTIEISSVLPPIRAILDMEYYFQAPETVIQVSQDPSIRARMNWIIIRGTQQGKEPVLAIRARHAHQLHEIWDAMIAAGAAPIGPAPGDLSLTTGRLSWADRGG